MEDVDDILNRINKKNTESSFDRETIGRIITFVFIGLVVGFFLIISLGGKKKKNSGGGGPLGVALRHPSPTPPRLVGVYPLK